MDDTDERDGTQAEGDPANDRPVDPKEGFETETEIREHQPPIDVKRGFDTEREIANRIDDDDSGAER